MSTHFTKAEIAFLEHRLVLPDTLHEVMQESDDGPVATLGNVQMECLRLRGDMNLGKSISEIVQNSDAVRIFCLRDAVEGSTYCATLTPPRGEATPATRVRLRRAIQTARSVANKLRAHGFVVDDAPEG